MWEMLDLISFRAGNEQNFTLPYTNLFLGLLFYPEDGGSIFLRNVSGLLAIYAPLYHRKWNSS
jgi:hypothetical protein